MTDTAIGGELSPQLLLEREVLAEPYEFYRRLRDEAPVWRVPGTTIVVLSSFDAVAKAVVRPADFSSNLRALLYRDATGAPATLPFDGGVGVDVLATADPPLHALHRSTVFPELVGKRMATLRGEIEELAETCMDDAFAVSPVEFMDGIANAVPIRVISKLIGFQDEDPDRLLDAAFASTGLLAATASLEDTIASTARATEMVDWIAAQLEDARSNGADGILGLIASAIAAGELAEIEGVVIMHTLLSAGGESTTSLLGNAVHILANDPDLQDTLRAHPELLTPFVEEVLRLESPFRYHMRHTPHDTELGGVEIPAGSTVLLLWGAANRDPAEYDDAADVVLTRGSPRHHVAFGRGIHLCVGAPLARLEAEVVLGGFLARTSDFALDSARTPVREHSLVVRRFARLPLDVTTSRLSV
jgi:cytochrome P450